MVIELSKYMSIRPNIAELVTFTCELPTDVIIKLPKTTLIFRKEHLIIS